MAEDADPRLLEQPRLSVRAQPLVHAGLEVLGRDGHTFGFDNQHSLGRHRTEAGPLDGANHGVDHVVFGAARLPEQDEISARRDAGGHGQVAAVAPHDLDDERAPVGGGGVGDLVAGFDDGVHRGVDADGQACQPHVVVNRRGHPHDQEPLGAELLGRAERVEPGE